VARVLGLPEVEDLGAQDLDLVVRIIRDGLRQFYNPPVLPRDERPHSWGFLRPTLEITTEADEHVYPAGDDFAELVEQPYYDETTAVYERIRIVGVAELNRQRAMDKSTGRPTRVAVVPTAFDEDKGQRYELHFHPTPDDEYTIKAPYQVRMDLPLEDESYPAGGMEHADTIQASCLAVAQELEGVGEIDWRAKFMTCLAASVGKDRRAHAARTLGYNGDRSDSRHSSARRLPRRCWRRLGDC
jgi:hypothetical protein